MFFVVTQECFHDENSASSKDMLFSSVFYADSEYRIHFACKSNYEGHICQIPSVFDTDLEKLDFFRTFFQI